MVYLKTTVPFQPGKSGKYCNLINRIPGLEYSGNSSKVPANLVYVPIFGAGFLRGGAGRKTLAYFSTHSFHCTFIMISMKKYGEKTK